jgi:cytochrome c553
MACTVCHGLQGRAGPDGYYPRLAGKPAAYLYNQLLNFRVGRRHYGLMAQLVEPLSDAYLMEIAQYFSALDVSYPAPAPATVSDQVLRQGQQLVLQGDASRRVPACVSCHGQQMTGALPHIPGLLGLPRDYLNAQLGAWKTGQRRAQAPDCMKEVVDRMSTEELHAAASWLATQPVPAGSKPVATLPAPAPGAVTLTCAATAAPMQKVKP